MNEETVLKFFETIRTDEAASERLRAAGDDVDEFLRLSVELGRERGFVFEASELRAALDELTSQIRSELSSEELSDVAGGRWAGYDVRQFGPITFRQQLPRTIWGSC